jgi:hypothetical protein
LALVTGCISTTGVGEVDTLIVVVTTAGAGGEVTASMLAGASTGTGVADTGGLEGAALEGGALEGTALGVSTFASSVSGAGVAAASALLISV